MTTYYLQPEDALTDFLRSYLDDPSGRVSSDSVTFTASVSQNSYALSLPDSVSCITSITVDGTELKKWKEYFWDYSSNTITFLLPYMVERRLLLVISMVLLIGFTPIGLTRI